MQLENAKDGQETLERSPYELFSKKNWELYGCLLHESFLQSVHHSLVACLAKQNSVLAFMNSCTASYEIYNICNLGKYLDHSSTAPPPPTSALLCLHNSSRIKIAVLTDSQKRKLGHSGTHGCCKRFSLLYIPPPPPTSPFWMILVMNRSGADSLTSSARFPAARDDSLIFRHA